MYTLIYITVRKLQHAIFFTIYGLTPPLRIGSHTLSTFASSQGALWNLCKMLYSLLAMSMHVFLNWSSMRFLIGAHIEEAGAWAKQEMFEF